MGSPFTAQCLTVGSEPAVMIWGGRGREWGRGGGEGCRKVERGRRSKGERVEKSRFAQMPSHSIICKDCCLCGHICRDGQRGDPAVGHEVEDGRGHGATAHHPVPSLIHRHTANPVGRALGEVGRGKRRG